MWSAYPKRHIKDWDGQLVRGTWCSTPTMAGYWGDTMSVYRML